MRKKFLTVALAATMAVASVFSAFAEDIDCTGWWAAHSAGTEITTEGVEIDFHTQSYDTAAENWNTPIYVVYAADSKFAGGAGISDTAGYTEYFVMRSDNYGWKGEANTSPGKYDALVEAGVSVESTGAPEDDAGWAEWLAANKAGVDCKITATKTADDKVVVEYTNNGITTKSTITVDAGKTVYLSVSGELCNITNLTAKASSGTPSTDPTPAPSEDEDKNDETTAGSNVTPSQTGDTSAVAVVAIVALGAAVAVVVSKKKVTE